MLAVSGTTDRANAAAMASQYLQRYQGLNRIILEKKGYSIGKMLDVATRKMELSQTPEWWDRLMKLGGYADFMSQGANKGTVAILSVQKGLIDEYIDGEVVPDKVE